MLKPINVNPIERSDTFYYECEQCGAKGTMHIKGGFNTDRPEELKEYDDLECPECGAPLGSDEANK